MPTYDVTITARVTKTIRVEADTEQEAIEQAHESFTTVCDGPDEKYEEDTDSVVEVNA
jgi:hypothetical protein